jgi:hypothetical protein
LWKFGLRPSFAFLIVDWSLKCSSIGGSRLLLQNLVDGTVVAVLNHCRHRVGCDGPASGIPDLTRGISDVGTYIEMDDVKGK